MADLEPTAREIELPSTDNTQTRRRAVCALYMRISTRNHAQTTDTQAIALREYAERRGFDIVEYRDEGISGTKDRRPALDRLMADARLRKLDVVVVARFDRFARSVKHLIKQGKQLGRRRVVVDREKVRELYKAGQSTRMIAAAMGLTKSTVFNIVNAN